MTFEEVLLRIETLSDLEWIFLPRSQHWGLDSHVAVLRMDEVPPEEEDLPDAGRPQYARDHDLVEALPVTVAQDVVRNLQAQVASPTATEMLAAFTYYYKNDAFMVV